MVGNTIGSAPASMTPRLTASMSCGDIAVAGIVVAVGVGDADDRAVERVVGIAHRLDEGLAQEQREARIAVTGQPLVGPIRFGHLASRRSDLRRRTTSISPAWQKPLYFSAAGRDDCLTERAKRSRRRSAKQELDCFVASAPAGRLQTGSPGIGAPRAVPTSSRLAPTARSPPRTEIERLALGLLAGGGPRHQVENALAALLHGFLAVQDGAAIDVHVVFHAA